MPLVRKHGSTAPRELALFWSMRTDAGENVDVYVYTSSLQAFDTAAIGPVGLMKRHRDLLEKVASDKFDLLGIDVRHPLHISTDDLLHAMTIDIGADLTLADDRATNRLTSNAVSLPHIGVSTVWKRRAGHADQGEAGKGSG